MRRGFTLVELVMVMVLLGILAVTAAPRVMDYPSMRRNLAARRIQSDIRYAQALAVGIQKRTGLYFRAAEDNYVVYIEQTPGNWAKATNPLTKADFDVQLNSGDFSGVDIEAVYFNGYNQALVFDQWGNPYGYNVGTGQAIALDNPAGVRLAGPLDVRVERGTGRVYLQ